MTPLKDRIYHLIRRAGPAGISGDDLFAIAYDGRLPRYQGGRAGPGETRQRSALKSNVYQLNKQIAANGHRIVGRGGTYRLIRIGLYDAEADAWGGVAEAYRVIRARVRQGGPGWAP
jgi:hypothetical protein